MANYPKELPAQTQNRQPGIESEMNPSPVYEYEHYKGADKLKEKSHSLQAVTAESDVRYLSLTQRKALTSPLYIRMSTEMLKIPKNAWNKRA